jgi:hypothetical protein
MASWAGRTSTGSSIGNPTFASFPDFLIGRAGCPAGTFPTTCNATTPGTSNGSANSNILQFTAATQAGGGFPYSPRVSDFNTFIQDDFKVNSRLTVNLGLRWEYDGFPTERYGDFTDVWPGLINNAPVPGSGCVSATGRAIGLGAAGTGCSLAGFMVPSNYTGPLPTGLYQSALPYQTESGPPYHDFAPRLGFAWQPTSSRRLVLRGGAGYFYERTNGSDMMLFPVRNTPGTIPLAPSAASSLSLIAVPPATIPGPYGGFGFTPRWYNPATTSGSNLSVNNMEPDLTVPVTYEWNLNTQYEFVRNWILEVGYVGSHGIHQMQPGGGGAPGRGPV